MKVEALLRNTVNNTPGAWVQINGVPLFVDDSKKVVVPSALAGKSIDSPELAIPQAVPNQTKQYLLSQLMQANSVRYPRLSEHLQNLANALHFGNEFDAERSQFMRLTEFLQKYKPLEPKMAKFMAQYLAQNKPVLEQLGSLIEQDAASIQAPQEQAAAEQRAPKLSVKKFGLYRFPFCALDRLDFGPIEQFPTIPQQLNTTGTHFKLWKAIKNVPFQVNGYRDDAYSAVTRALAAQAGKVLGLQCEEVFLGTYHGKVVTLTAFHEAVTLLENLTYQLYPLAPNYEYQNEQKRAFYFLIQNWTAYAQSRKRVPSAMKNLATPNMDPNAQPMREQSVTLERFNCHFVDSDGNVYLSRHEHSTFLTPQQMASNLMVKLVIDAYNYRPIRDMVDRIGNIDLADVVFGSIPPEYVEMHDDVAERINQATFEQRKLAFASNWDNLLKGLKQFEARAGQ